VGEEIYELWKDQVKIIHVLDDIGWPTSCEDWGNYTGGLLDGIQYPNIEGIPPIIDDGNANFGDAMIQVGLISHLMQKIILWFILLIKIWRLILFKMKVFQ